jgi:hypothetical protein
MSMERYYFKEDEFNIVEQMVEEGYSVHYEDNKVISTDEDDAEVEPALFDNFGLDNLEGSCYSVPEIKTMGGQWNGFGENILVFDGSVSHSFNNYGLWSSCVGGVYCDKDDYLVVKGVN